MLYLKMLAYAVDHGQWWFVVVAYISPIMMVASILALASDYLSDRRSK